MLTTDQNITNLEKWLLTPASICDISKALAVKETNYGGKGIFATETIKPHQRLLKIAHSYLLNFTTVISNITFFNDKIHLPLSYAHIKVTPTEEDGITKRFYSQVELSELLNLTSFQIVSLYIVLESQRGERSWWKYFLRMLPDVSDFKLSPLVWLFEDDNEVFSQLPQTTQNHAKRIYKNFTDDLETVSELLKKYNIESELAKERFLWAWMCVNSRCLYMALPQAHTTADNFTMAPFVDFINHSPQQQCTLKIDRTGFFVNSGDKGYETGSELYLSYGAHSNEFLLCEYAFTLRENEWNDLDITDQITDLMNEREIEYLKETDYYGDYTLTSSTMSFRTEVAFAVIQEGDGIPLLQNRRLASFLNGADLGTFYKREMSSRLMGILEGLKESFQDKLKLEYSSHDREKVVGKLYRDFSDIIESHISEF